MKKTTNLHYATGRGSAWMCLSLVCFASNALLLKSLTTERLVDPWLTMAARSGIGLIITMAFFYPRGQLRLGRCFTGWLLASRGVIGAIATAAFYHTVGALGAGKATFISNTWCVFAAILAAVVLAEPLKPLKAIGILLALVGLGFLTGLTPGEFTHFGHYEALALMGALLAAMVVVVIRQLTGQETSATIFSSQCIYCMLLAVPMACWHFKAVNGQDLFWILTAGSCASVGQLAMTEGFRYLSVAAGSAFQVTLPLLITLVSVQLFAEPFTQNQALGAALVLWGSLQTVLMQQPKTLE
jgi:drug/metabolite transporter (DMT)-like permease